MNMSLIVASLACAFFCNTAFTQTLPSRAQVSARSRGAVSRGRLIAAALPCDAPDSASTTPEETAWRLFVYAACPVNANSYPYVKWETWSEQFQLYRANAPLLAAQQRPRFHGSPLRAFVKFRDAASKFRQPNMTLQDFLKSAAQGCEEHTSGRTICEETRINPDAQRFIVDNGLARMDGQRSRAAAGKDFEFPRAAIEIKADWIQLKSCDEVPADVHFERVDGVCYELAGMHVISKLIDKWVWATFEPQNSTSNPQRCKVLQCRDSWGSNPAVTAGAPTLLTPALSNLMTAAQLPPEWRNYRLDGVQVDFMDGAVPTKLGNSIIEGENVGADLNTSSCITCHRFSTVRADGKPAMAFDFKLGDPLPFPSGMVSRDFVWSLFLAQ